MGKHYEQLTAEERAAIMMMKADNCSARQIAVRLRRAAGLAGAASAQSNVTIFGVVDLGIAKGNGGTATNQGANGTSDAWNVKQASASRLGFRGTEDLGGGLSAGFNLDNRFTPDDGVVGANFWAQSYVTLSSKTAGTLWLGRNYVSSFWVAIRSDPFGMDGVAQVGPAALFADFSSTAGTTRTNNTVGYKSPKMNGFFFDVGVSAGEGTTGRQTGFNVQYEKGPLYAGLGYEKIDGGSAALDGNQLLNLTFHYNFGVMRAIAYAAQSKTAGGTRTNRQVMLAGDAPLGNGRLKAAVWQVDPSGNNNTRSKVSVGYDYHLSKLTRVYADFGVARQDGRSNNNAYAVGIRKAF